MKTITLILDLVAGGSALAAVRSRSRYAKARADLASFGRRSGIDEHGLFGAAELEFVVEEELGRLRRHGGALEIGLGHVERGVLGAVHSELASNLEFPDRGFALSDGLVAYVRPLDPDGAGPVELPGNSIASGDVTWVRTTADGDDPDVAPAVLLGRLGVQLARAEAGVNVR